MTHTDLTTLDEAAFETEMDRARVEVSAETSKLANETFHFDRALTPPESERVTRWLAARWRIPLAS